MARMRPKNKLERSLLELWNEIQGRPRETWSVDDRNALMAISLYLDPENQGTVGDSRVLENCSDPRLFVLRARAA